MAPATSVLVVGQSLSDTENLSALLDLSNYVTRAASQSITSVQINYSRSAADAQEPLADGETNAFSVTIADTAGNVRTFYTAPRPVVHAAPVSAGGLTDRMLT